MINKIRLVLISGSILSALYFFCKRATCFIYFLLLQITVFNTIQM